MTPNTKTAERRTLRLDPVDALIECAHESPDSDTPGQRPSFPKPGDA